MSREYENSWLLQKQRKESTLSENRVDYFDMV